jgi:hypothetical protein
VPSQPTGQPKSIYSTSIFISNQSPVSQGKNGHFTTFKFPDIENYPYDTSDTFYLSLHVENHSLNTLVILKVYRSNRGLYRIGISPEIVPINNAILIMVPQVPVLIVSTVYRRRTPY